MKRLPGWVARDLRPTDRERESALQPIDQGMLAWCIRNTEPESLWLRSTIRQLQDLPEAAAWAPKPDEPADGGQGSHFPNAPPSSRLDGPDSSDVAHEDGDPLETDHSVESPETTRTDEEGGDLTQILPDLDAEGEPSSESIVSARAEDVPIGEPEDGLEGGDMILLSEAAQALLDAENALAEHVEEDVEPIPAPAELPPDPNRGAQTRGRRAHHMHEIDDPVPTPRWLLLLLLLLLGLAGGETEQGKKALDDLSREELAWSLSGQLMSTPSLPLGAGIVVRGPASVSSVSVGSGDSTIQLTEGQISAVVGGPEQRQLIVQAGAAVVSTRRGRIEVLRNGERIDIYVEDGEVIVQTSARAYSLSDGEQLTVEGNGVYGASSAEAPSSASEGSPTPLGDGSSTGAMKQSGSQSAQSAPTGQGQATSREESASPERPMTTASSAPTSGAASLPVTSSESSPAPALPQLADSPFDDVLQALNAGPTDTCEDDTLTSDVPKEPSP